MKAAKFSTLAIFFASVASHSFATELTKIPRQLNCNLTDRGTTRRFEYNLVYVQYGVPYGVYQSYQFQKVRQIDYDYSHREPTFNEAQPTLETEDLVFLNQSVPVMGRVTMGDLLVGVRAERNGAVIECLAE